MPETPARQHHEGRAITYRLDNGTGALALGIAFPVLGCIVAIANRGGGFIVWWLFGWCWLMGAVGIGLGLRRRKAHRVEHGVWRNEAGAAVPREPFAYLSNPRQIGNYLREPALMTTFGLVFFGFAGAFTLDGSMRAKDGVVAMVFAAVVFAAIGLLFIAIGVRRWLWFRRFRTLTGHTPW